LKVSIIGAGIGGLAAATALAQNGHSVRVLERAPEIGEVGAGIQISPNGMAVMRALGMGEALDPVSIRAEAVRLIDGPSGRTITTLDLATHAPDLDWRFIHRARLIDVLLTRARDLGVTLETGAETAPPPEGAALPGDDLLVGADGLHSKTRARVDEASKPFFTRQVAWRALIEGDGAPVVEIHMGPKRHLVTYPLSGGLRNIVAVEERIGWADEGWSHDDHPANLRGAFAGFNDRAQGWLAEVETCFLWGLFRHRVADRWHSGHQVILGDAAHPTLPFLAQGANMALEDAFVLAQSLSDTPSIEAGLRTYEAARKPRTEAVVDAATQNARNYHLSFPPLRLAAHALLGVAGNVAPGRILGRYDWIYRHDVTKTG
jgi:salicylate hydroxylase